MAGTDVHRRSYGRAFEVTLDATVLANQIAIVNTVVGLTVQSGDSGETVVLEREDRVIEVELPSAFYSSLSVGDKVYLVLANITGHTLDDDAWTLTATSNFFFGHVVELLGSNNAALSMEVTGH